MTIKEITALRKAGQLEGALRVAEEEFAAHPDKFTAGALFWCLFEEVTKNRSAGKHNTSRRSCHVPSTKVKFYGVPTTINQHSGYCP